MIANVINSSLVGTLEGNPRVALYVLDVKKDQVRKLGQAPAPPPDDYGSQDL